MDNNDVFWTRLYHWLQERNRQKTGAYQLPPLFLRRAGARGTRLHLAHGTGPFGLACETLVADTIERAPVDPRFLVGRPAVLCVKCFPPHLQQLIAVFPLPEENK